MLTWNTDPAAIPFDVPVLAFKHDKDTPYMCVRHSFYEPNMVDTLLDADPSGYGWYTSIADIARWAIPC